MYKQTIATIVSRFVLPCVFAVAGVVGCPAASAQFSLFRGMTGNRPAMTASDLTRHGKLLQLTPAQVEAAKELLASYTSEYEQASKARREKLREISEEFQESRDFSVMEQAEPVEEKFQRDSSVLESTLLGDLRAILTAEQDTIWPKYERTRRREKTIEQGTLAGESVDLVRIVDELGLTDDARKPLVESIEQYEVDLDRVLAERNKVLEAQGDMFPRPGRGGGAIEIDMAKIEDHSKNVREAGGKVRDVNQRYARNFEGLLSEDIRPKFQAGVKRESFPQVYRASRTAKAFEAAVAFDDLDAKQREAINVLQEQFARDAEAANDKWAQAIVEEEQSGGGASGFGGMIFSIGNENEDTPVAQARKAKREVEKKSMDGLKSLLNEKQIERLPKREEAAEVERSGGMMLRMSR